MKLNLPPKSLLAMLVVLLSHNSMLQAQEMKSQSYSIDNYDQTGRPLPPGVPRDVDTNGTVTYIPHRFTTKAYQEEAAHLVIQEANQVAQELKLPEELPITTSNSSCFISPFGFAYARKMIGSASTKNYIYYVSRGDKFSNVTVADYDQTCFKFRDFGTLPITQYNTNDAYQLAAQWLTETHMDLAGLNHDCKVHVAISPYWNGLVKFVDKPQKPFVPIYYVWWTSPENDSQGNDSAHIELYLPTKALIQFSVEDPKYILRNPIVFTNLAALFPGTALIRTNFPSESVPGPILPRVNEPPPGEMPGPAPLTDK